MYLHKSPSYLHRCSSMHNISAKEPYVSAKDVCIRKRANDKVCAIYLQKRTVCLQPALCIRKRALCIRKRALCIRKRDDDKVCTIYQPKSSMYPQKSSIYSGNSIYPHKSRICLQKSPVFPKKSPMNVWKGASIFPPKCQGTLDGQNVILTKAQILCGKEPTSAKEPYISAKEPYISEKEPYEGLDIPAKVSGTLDR